MSHRRRQMRGIAELLRPYRGRTVLMAVSLLLATAAALAPPPLAKLAIDNGIGECDLVRLKGKPATDVLVGESGKGQREVQVLYTEPGAKELYFFVNNRLDRIVK